MGPKQSVSPRAFQKQTDFYDGGILRNHRNKKKSSKGVPSTPQHTDSHPCIRLKIRPYFGNLGTTSTSARKYGKKRNNHNVVVLFASFGPAFMVSLWKRYAYKLRGIILLHFELISFRFAYGRGLKPLISMISGVWDVSLSPKTNMIYLWRPQDTFNNSGTTPIRYEN